MAGIASEAMRGNQSNGVEASRQGGNRGGVNGAENGKRGREEEWKRGGGASDTEGGTTRRTRAETPHSKFSAARKCHAARDLK